MTFVSTVMAVSLAGVGIVDAQPELVVAFDPTQGELPESITIDDDGSIFLSMGNTIRKLTPDLELSLYATLPGSEMFALGLKIGPDGCLYNVSASFSPDPPGAFVWRICDPGVVEEVAALDPNGGPNDLAFDDEGNIYVTDLFIGQIWKIDPAGNAAVWLADPLLVGNPADPKLILRAFGADGIAFDRHKHNLFVSNLDYGMIIRIPVNDGSPGEPEVFVADERLEGADGIAFDKHGTLYVAVNAQDRLAAIDEDGGITILAEAGLLDGPASLAFGVCGRDKKTLYVANLAFSRAFGLIPGTPRPSLVRLSVPKKGLALP
jgi:sugar lactone lactonase YvrE